MNYESRIMIFLYLCPRNYYILSFFNFYIFNHLTMAKKRIAMNGLHYLMSDLFTATVIAAADKKANMEKVAEAQEKILKVYEDFNSRLSNYERKNAKAFFKQYQEELSKEIDTIGEAIDTILK